MPILFTEEHPNVYLISEIYDPDTNPTGQTIPRPGSIVIDIANETGLLHWVKSVDPTTNKSLLGICKTSLLLPEEEIPGDESYIIDYGNTRFFLYYDMRIHPTRITPDKKIIVIGSNNSYYELFKYNDTTHEYEIISLNYDTDGNYIGSNIPLEVANNTNNVKYCGACFTNKNIQENDKILLRIFDNNGSQTGEIVLHGKQAIIENIYHTPIIDDFILTATQEMNNVFYLYPGQSFETLVVIPKIIYDTGVDQIIPIDNQICHLYSDIENFVPSFPGQTAKLIVKYFLTPEQDALNVIETGNGTRYLMAEKDIIVISNPSDEYQIKISVIPKYDYANQKYNLFFYLYTIDDDQVRDITQYIADFTPPFDGREYNNDQILRISFDLQDVFTSLTSSRIIEQSVKLRLRENINYEKYLISDTSDETIYGVDSITTRRPVLYFDTATEEYFIPTSIFDTVGKVINSFYYKAKPPYENTNLEIIPTPTHFNIRDILTNTILINSHIPLNAYQTKFQINNIVKNMLVNGSCIVEFYNEITPGVFKTLYGVPVDVYNE